MITYSTNKRGETLEHCSDGITLNFSYWECDCTGEVENWIHRIDVKQCPVCNALEQDHPTARALDVDIMVGSLG